jgi:hypothetical protein
MKNFWEPRHRTAKINLGDRAGAGKRGGKLEDEAMASCGRSANMPSQGDMIAREIK